MTTEDLKFTTDEIVMLNNCLNELCNGVRIDDWEFQTRLGWTRNEMRNLLAKIHSYMPDDR